MVMNSKQLIFFTGSVSDGHGFRWPRRFVRNDDFWPIRSTQLAVETLNYYLSRYAPCMHAAILVYGPELCLPEGKVPIGKLVA